MTKRTALISVSNRSGLVELAGGLRDLGYELLTTSGTGAFLAKEGFTTRSIEHYTSQAEIFGGRVKTLHPMIYAGILARRDVPEDLELLTRDGIAPIDVVVVNLYPFRDALIRDVRTGRETEAELSDEQMIELIDIGGPSMIRAAAKNHHSVLPLIDPADYERALDLLAGRVSEQEESSIRRDLAAKVFAILADDAVAVAGYLTGERPLSLAAPRQLEIGAASEAASTDGLTSRAQGSHWNGVVLRKEIDLRYGENPHQRAAFFKPIEPGKSEQKTSWRVLGGKALSYNNMLDLDAMIRLLNVCAPRSLARGREETEAAIIVKHLNPCGAARGVSVADALQKAKRSDPRSHFGGIIGFSGAVSLEAAKSIREDFAEVVVAPAYDADAQEVLLKSKNLRVIQVVLSDFAHAREVRSVLDGYLVQQRDEGVSLPESWEVVSNDGEGTSKDEDLVREDLYFAWQLCSQVKSNAIVIVKDQMLLGVGAGQMSRIDSVEVALMKARFHGHDLSGAVAASDAFFPFPDAIEELAKAGIRAVIVPRGAKRDEEVLQTAMAHNVRLCFSNDRHFRH